MDETSDIVVGVIFWIGAWQLVSLLNEKISKRTQFIIYSLITIISLIMIFRLNKKKNCKKENKENLKD